MNMASPKAGAFSLSAYIEQALKLAEYEKDVGMGLLRKIVRDAGVSVDEWQKL